MTIDEFPAWVKQGNWIKVATALEVGQYRPSPVRRVEIDKPDGGKRQLGIPTITDRVIQQAIAQVLTPIFDPDFSDNSLGFVQIVMGNKRSSRCKASLKRDAVLQSMSICQSSLIG